MYKKEQTGTAPLDTAVSLTHVTKTFVQSQRKNTGEGVLKNLFHPEQKQVSALQDVSFTILPGEFAAYAGPNGAGKSTTMKLICGMLQPGTGCVTALGLSPREQRIALMKRMGVLFGNRTELWWDHPVLQSFQWKKTVWNIPDKEYEENFDMVTELLDLKHLLRTFVRELSLGQRMRADLAMLLLHSPELILLDEPTLGLDVVAKRQMIAFLKQLNRERGVTILVTSHDMDDLEEMAQRVLMVSNGRIAFDGGFDALRKLTGSLSQITVTLSGARAPRLEGCRLLEARSGVCRYETDLEGARVGALLQQIGQLDGVRDVEIRKAPMEQVIAELYKNWKETGEHLI